MSVGSTSSSSTSNTSNANTNVANGLNAAFGNLGPSDFLNMIMAELKNQDPLQPTDTNAMLQELTTLSQLSANQTLSSTMSSLNLEQSISSASNLIGATVQGLSDNATQISGTVSGVSVSGGEPKLNIGTDTMSLSNIESITVNGVTTNTGTGSSGTDTSGTSGGSTSDGSTAGGTTTGGTSTGG